MKNAVYAEVAANVGFVCVIFLFFWGFGQLADPIGYSLIAQIPNSIAWAAFIIAIGAAIVEWRCKPRSKKTGALKCQTIKKIKAGRIFF